MPNGANVVAAFLGTPGPPKVDVEARVQCRVDANRAQLTCPLNEKRPPKRQRAVSDQAGTARDLVRIPRRP